MTSLAADISAGAPGHGGFAWRSLFRMLAARPSRRRASDAVRLVAAGIAVALLGVVVVPVPAIAKSWAGLMDALPTTFADVAEWCFIVAVALVAGLPILLTLILRNWRVLLFEVVAVASAIGFGALVERIVEAQDARDAAGISIDGNVPQFPVTSLAVAIAVATVARPFLTVPLRRVLTALIATAAISAPAAGFGLPSDVIAGIAVGWGAAALIHLVVGTPSGQPDVESVIRALADLGVTARDVVMPERQLAGFVRFQGVDDRGRRLSIHVVGRDDVETQRVARWWHSLWYKEPSPSLRATIEGEVEDLAYTLLLAERAGARVSDLVVAGLVEDERLALLAVARPPGTLLAELPAREITDATLDDAWTNLQTLRRARVAHGSANGHHVLVLDDGTTMLHELATPTTNAPGARLDADRVELLVATSLVVGNGRSLNAAQRALGHDDLVAMIPMLQPAMLSTELRSEIDNPKKLMKQLRDDAATMTGVEVPKVIEMRRVPPSRIFMIVLTIFGFYLLAEQLLSEGDLWSTLQDASMPWVVLTFLLAPLAQFGGTMAMKGSVPVDLPTGPVVGVQFATNFTGLVAGTTGNFILNVRFFQQQGQPVATAVSSGTMIGLGGFLVQIVVVTIGLLFTSSNLDTSSTSSSSSSSSGSSLSWQTILLILLVAVLVIGIATRIPKARQLYREQVKPQLSLGIANLKAVLRTPRKALELFGGQLFAQLMFGITLDAALHAFGYDLPLIELMTINCLASFIGGIMPIPGGLGVVEAGLIAGMTAYGIPQDIAVATTFLYRLFTSYLPPLWGWAALQWLRRRDYV